MSAREARLITLPDPSTSPPHCCVLTGRTDGEMVDTQTFYEGVDPHIVIRRSQWEYVAKELLGMVSAKQLAEVEAQRDELAERAERAERKLADSERLQELWEKLKVEVAEAYEQSANGTSKPEEITT